MTILTKEEYLSLVEILAFEYGYLNLKEVMQDTKASAIPYQKLIELINEHFDNTPDFKGFKLHSDSTLMTFKKKELVDYIHMVYHHWQGTDSACNIGMKYAEKLQKINDKLEKALDKACGLLKEAVSQDCYIFDEVIEENYSYITEKEEWKEWCLKDE